MRYHLCVRLRKRIEKMRQAQASVAPEEMHAVLAALGFSFRPARGDHRLYYHPRLPYPVGIDPRRPLLPAYVRKALAAIDEVIPNDEDDD